MGSQSDQAVALLQDMIERGELKPGSMVSERGLVEVTGLGRTPVREALQRLALTRMLRIHASKGIEIPAVSVEDQLNGLEVRRVMERLSVLLACQRATSKDIGELAQLRATLADAFDLRGYAETVRQTHVVIIRATGNPYLEAALTPLQSLSRRFWFLHVQDETKEITAGKALHTAILSGVMERDADAACAASLALNDYLVRFALATVSERARPAS
ncbi:GntR family transcriptional regulator [Gemmobacter fulvus]|uniref:GntR family transcriptional regulator n=1 Tax=Gemmobacter fulvus TaxID=2840474 RepID=UPI00279649F3|nr:GntR family transcriptional regulator [Gemmobacter fulvus]MDQ1850642.1 GntR family transcriptional regulator [Gemmobacter fulvus]